jgi:type IV pilus assembly protein PilE
MAQRPRRSSAGFSLVELLVVMAFIAILASIAVPHFTNVTNRAHDATVKSDVRNAMAVEEEQYIHGGGYVAFLAANGARVDPPGFSPSDGVTVTATLVGNQVRIVGTHPRASNPWCMSSSGGDVVEGAEC